MLYYSADVYIEVNIRYIAKGSIFILITVCIVINLRNSNKFPYFGISVFVLIY